MHSFRRHDPVPLVNIYDIHEQRKSAPSYGQYLRRGDYQENLQEYPRGYPVRNQRESRTIPERTRSAGPTRFEEPRTKPTAKVHLRDEYHETRWVAGRNVPQMTNVIHPVVDDDRFEAVKVRQADDAVRSIRRGQFQNTCDVNAGRDFTIHFDFPVFEDYDQQFEALSYLRRLGQFQAAREYVKAVFWDQLSHPYVFIQYAELLLDMGDYKSFEHLDPSIPFGEQQNTRPESVRPRQSETTRHFYPLSRGKDRTMPHASEKTNLPTTYRDGTIAQGAYPAIHSDVLNAPYADRAAKANKKDQSRDDGHHLLRCNWRLLKAMFQLHHTGTVNEALEEARFVLDNLVLGPEIGSTEIQIVSLALRIFGIVGLWLPDILKREVRDSLEVWTEWSTLYNSLLAQGRIWDFRDIFLSAIGAFGQKWACSKFFSASPWREAILDNWILKERDQSTTLAQLDILTSMIFHLNLPERGFGQMEWIPRDAQILAEFIMNKYPDSMTSRPFLSWLVVKAATMPVTQQPDVDRAAHHPSEMFRDWPGLSIAFPGWIWLPIYVPLGREIPPWVRPEIPEVANDPVRLVLTTAMRTHDYSLQVLCLTVLILRSQQPQKLFDQLCELQKSTQGDMEGYLSTCLSRYLIDRDKQSQKQLLFELKEMDDWASGYELRAPFCYLAKNHVQTALSAIIKGRDHVPPPTRVSLNYFPWLPDGTISFLGNEFGPKISPSRLPRDGRVPPYHEDIPPDFTHEDHERRKREGRSKPARTFSGIPVVLTKQRKEPQRSGREDRVGATDENDRRVPDMDKHGERRSRSSSRSRRRSGSVREHQPTRTVSTSDSDWSESSSTFAHGGVDFLARFPHMPESSAVEMSERKVEGKRIILEVRDVKTNEKSLDVNWVKEGDNVTMTMSGKDNISITINKQLRSSGKEKIGRHLPPRWKRRWARRHRHSESSSSDPVSSSDSDDADSEGDGFPRVDATRIPRFRRQDRESRAREYSGHQYRAPRRPTEVDPTDEPEPEPGIEPQHKSDREREDRSKEAGPSTRRPETDPSPEAEIMPDIGVKDT